MNKGRTGTSSCAAFQGKTQVLLFVWLVRFGLWLRLIRGGLLGCALSAGLRLRNQQHPRAAVQVHVLTGGSDHRTLRGIRSRRVQVQAVQPKHALAVGSELTRGIQAADGSLRSASDAPACVCSGV